MNGNDVVFRVIDALEHANVPYMLVGSYSSNAYGIPRSTQDADFVIELGNTPFNVIAEPLLPEITIDPQLLLETVTGTYRWIGRHLGSEFTVELFQLGHDAFMQQRFARRRREDVLGHLVWLPTAEDVVIQKLRWYGRAKRSKDLDDARDVVAVQSGRLDLPYIRNWCDQHGTRALLEQLLIETASI